MMGALPASLAVVIGSIGASFAAPVTTSTSTSSTTTAFTAATSTEFTQAKAHQTPSQAFGSRLGPVLESIPSSNLMLFGGKRGGLCLSDAWTSSGPGSAWSVVSTTSSSKPSGAADAPTAVDAAGCLWMLGGDCNDRKGTFWKTCDSGLTWSEIARPTVLPVGSTGSVLPTYPTAFVGHAIAVVGSWQIVIVDAMSDTGGVWAFSDRAAQFVRKVAEAPLPFLRRRDPRLLATSDALYLLGGHLCEDLMCSNNRAFNDVWRTNDTGATWTLEAAHFAKSLFSTYSVGIGRYFSAVVTRDDTIYLVGGHRSNSTEALSTAFYSKPGLVDSSFDDSANLWVSTSWLAHPFDTHLSFVLCFMEGVQEGSGQIQLLDYGSDGTPGGIGGNADTVIPVTVNISRQMLSITTNSTLIAAHKHEIIVPSGSVQDLAGNPFLSTIRQSLFPDSAGPVVQSVSPAGAGVAPWTTVMLTMNEDVSKGDGALRLVPAAGRELLLDISSSLIVGQNVFFELPASERLTEGQEYSITIPRGLLKDKYHNVVGDSVAGTFLVFSGSYTSNNYVGDSATVRSVAPKPGTSTSTPTLISTYPPSGATDVPVAPGVSLLLFFSKPVRFNAYGAVSFRNPSGLEVTSLNLTANPDALVRLPEYNAVKIIVPRILVGGASMLLLRRGTSLNVTMPRGTIEDLNGNPCDEIAVAFTCLVGSSDMVPPAVVLTSPHHNQKQVRGSTSSIDIFFSEAIEAVNGSIMLKRINGSNLSFDIAGSSVSISGPKLSLALPPGAMSTSGQYTLNVPAGIVRDLARVVPGGVRSEGGRNLMAKAAVVNFTVNADTVGPVLNIAGSFPAHESTPQFQRPPSTGFLLTFSETVQAGDGYVVLTPTYTPTAVRIPARNASLSGSKAFLSPSSSLVPGEAYSISVESNAFLDLSFNKGSSTQNKYVVSIAPNIRFEQLGSSQFTSSPVPSGSRYGSGIAVDDLNVIYVAAGRTPNFVEYNLKGALQANVAPPSGKTSRDVCTETFLKTLGNVIVMCMRNVGISSVPFGSVTNVSLSSCSSARLLSSSESGAGLESERKRHLATGRIEFIVPRADRSAAEDLRARLAAPSAATAFAASFVSTLDQRTGAVASGVSLLPPEVKVSAGTTHDLNDVWRLDTQRPTNCASAFEPRDSCSSSVCLAGNPPTLGIAQVERKIWRAATGSGTQCLAGSNASIVGTVVTTRTEVCPCPLCLTPPSAPLPENMDLTSLSSYSFVSAASSSCWAQPKDKRDCVWSLRCKAGYSASGGFVCEMNTTYLGGFSQPYPTCQPLSCTSPPNTAAVAHFAQFNTTNSTGSKRCAAVTTGSPMPHGGTCGITCAAGWKAIRSFRCHLGAFQAGACAPQHCSMPPLRNGTFQCGASKLGVARTGEQCAVICDAGFSPHAASVVSCAAAPTAALEALPIVSPIPKCSRNICGEFDPSLLVGAASIIYKDSIPHYALKGALQANVAPPKGKTSQDMCDAEFLKKLGNVIVMGMRSLEINVPLGSVRNVSLSSCSNARLLSPIESGAGLESERKRRLATGRIDFIVPRADQNAAEMLRVKLANSSVARAFAASFVSNLDRFTGANASGVSLLPPEVQVDPFQEPARSLGDSATASCEAGYQPSAHTGLELRCGPVVDSPGQGAVEWKSATTGKGAGPPCVLVGYKSIPKYVLKGALQANVAPPPGNSSQDLCNVTFLEKLENVIVMSMQGIGADVPLGSVKNVSLSSCSNARLLSSADGGADLDSERKRHLAAGRIDFLVPRADQNAAESLRASLAAPSAAPAFAASFVSTLDQRTGAVASGVSLLPPEVKVFYENLVVPTTTTTTTTFVPPPAAASESSGPTAAQVILGTLIGFTTTSAFIVLVLRTAQKKLAEEARAEIQQKQNHPSKGASPLVPPATGKERQHAEKQQATTGPAAQ